MYYAIETHYLGPTNYRGARIVAECDEYRVTIPYPYEAGEGSPAHRIAAEALLARNAEEYGHSNPMRIVAYGATRRGYVFIIAPAGAE